MPLRFGAFTIRRPAASTPDGTRAHATPGDERLDPNVASASGRDGHGEAGEPLARREAAAAQRLEASSTCCLFGPSQSAGQASTWMRRETAPTAPPGNTTEWRYGAKWPLHRGCATLMPWESSMSIEARGEITSKARRTRPERRLLGLLRAAALIAVLAGAVCSVGLLLHAGQRNNSRLVLVLFTMWVLSPFVALVSADVVSKRWSVVTPGALYGLMLVLPLGSVAIYSTGAFKPVRSGAVFLFVALPPVSWLLIAVVVSIAALISGRASRRLP